MWLIVPGHYVERLILPFFSASVHFFHDFVSPCANPLLSLRPGTPDSARVVAYPGADLLLHPALLAADDHRPRTDRPEEALRHRREPQHGDRHSGALLYPAQFPLGVETRGLQNALLRAVPRAARRHLHRPRPCRRGAGATGPRRQDVDFARGFGGYLSRGHAFEGR